MSKHTSLFLHILGIGVHETMFRISLKVYIIEEHALPLPPAEDLLALLPIIVILFLFTAIPCLLSRSRSFHLIFHVPDDLSVALCLLTDGHLHLVAAAPIDPYLLLQLLLHGLPFLL